MPELRRSRPSDLACVASWIGSAEECRLWCGARVAYPIDLAALPAAIEYGACESWSAAEPEGLVAFGQLVPKQGGRLHLARLISAPSRRGCNFGRLITSHLLEVARTQGASAVSLNVFAENQPAVTLYSSLGFAPCDRPASESASESLYMQYDGDSGKSN